MAQEIVYTIIGRDKATGTFVKVEQTMQNMNRTAKQINKNYKVIDTSAQNFANKLQNVVGIAKAANNQFKAFWNATRLAGQGLMTAGKMMSLFITAPIVLFMKSGAEAAIEFEDALVRVSKTTELAGANLAKLGMGLRDQAKRTTTSHTELAKMAEQVGQIGVRGVPQILALVDIFNQLTVATDIASDSVAQDIGRIATAFGVDLSTDEGVEEIRRFANVINELENRVNTTAPEIVEGMLNFAQVGSTVFKDMTAQSLTAGSALVATLVSAGFSAEEAGNGLRNLTLKMVQNKDVLLELLGAQEKYNTEAKLAQAINEDFGGLLIDLVGAAGGGADAIEKLSGMFDLAGIRGGKAGATLASVFDSVIENVGIANAEFDRAISLHNEYEKALLSTKSHLEVLKNNIADVAIELGNTLLPVINQLAEIAIPIVRDLVAFFAALPEQAKLTAVGFTAILAVAGPLLMFFGGMIFAVSMLMISFANMIGIGLTLVSTLISIAGALGTIAGIVPILIIGLAAVASAIMAGLAAALGFFIGQVTGIHDRIATFFSNLAQKMETWGANLIETLGAGMLSSAVIVLTKVLTAIGNLIAGFLRAFSPPKEGPLKHIDKWGKNLMDTYLKSFLNADFGILSDVTGVIEGILKNFDIVGKISEGQQFTFAMEARQALSKLISIFNETGNVAEDVLSDVVKNLGEASDEVEDLIRLWLEYNRIQEELRKLEERREGVLDTYRQEVQLIAQANMTAEEKAAAIREAMRGRDEELRTIEQQEDALEDELDVAEEQLQFQQEMIKAMQKQDDLQASLLKKLDNIASKLGGIEFPEFDTSEFDFSGAESGVQDLVDKFLTLEEKIGRAQFVWDTFLASLRGEPLPDQDEFISDQLTPEQKLEMGKYGLSLEEVDPHLANIIEMSETARDVGGQINTTWTDIKETIELVVSPFVLIRDTIKDIQDSIAGLEGSEGTGGVFANLIPDNVKQIWEDLGALDFTELAEDWDMFTGRVGELKDAVLGLVDPFLDVVNAFFDLVDINIELESLGQFLALIAKPLVDILGAVAGVTVSILKALGSMFLNIATGLADINIWALENFAEQLGVLAGILRDIKENGLIDTLSKLWTLGSPGWEGNEGGGGGKGPGLSKIIMEEGLGERIQTWWNTKILPIVNSFGSTIGTAFGAVKTAWTAGWLAIRQIAISEWVKIRIKIIEWVEKAKTSITDKVTAFKNAGKDLIQGLIDGIVEKSGEFLAKLRGMAEEAIRLWGIVTGSNSPSKVFMEKGRELVEGLAIGITQNEGMAFDAVTGLGNTVGASSALTPVASEGAGGLHVHMHNPIVREDQDIERIAEAVERALSRKVRGNMSMGNAY